MLKKLAHYEPQVSYYKCSHLQKDPPDPAPSSLMTKSLASLKTTPSTWTVDFQGLRICMSQGRLSHTLSWRTRVVKRKGEEGLSRRHGDNTTQGVGAQKSVATVPWSDPPCTTLIQRCIALLYNSPKVTSLLTILLVGRTPDT